MKQDKWIDTALIGTYSEQVVSLAKHKDFVRLFFI